MTSDIEKAFLNFIAALLLAEDVNVGTEDKPNVLKAATIVGTPGAVVPIVTAKSNEFPPAPLPDLVITCNDAPVDVEPLYMARVTLSISTPQRVEGITEDTHRQIVKVVRGLMIADNADALETALQGVGNLSQRGWAFLGPNEGIHGERWQCDLNYSVGIEETPG